MTIDLLDSDPKSNLVEFKKAARVPSLLPVRAGYNACKHSKVYVRQESREVECRECGVKLDAFDVLMEMANKERRWLQDLDEWDARRESVLSERYDQQWARDHDGIIAPPSDESLRKIWDTFHAVIGDRFCRMYSRKRMKRNGPQWYGVSNHGHCLSYEYARSLLTPSVAAPRVVGK